MDAPAYNGDDTREFGPVHHVCRECGGDDEGGHEITCSYHPDAYQPDVPEWVNEPDNFDQFAPVVKR